jgi:chemotaxis protein methyltransferase CheR
MALPLEIEDQRAIHALEIDLLLRGVFERYGYDFRDYARASLTRRIRRAMQVEAVPTVSALQARLLHDEDAAMRFVAAISVHTTSMFRDVEVYKTLRSEVIPFLRTYPFVRIWHAGCSTGEEVYSLAILLEELGVYERCRIYATDISDTILDRARKGVVPLRAMREYTQGYQRSGGTQDFSAYYSTDQENAVFRASLKRNLVFSQHNLVSDSVFNEFQLIMCRNVLLYFNEALRDRAHDLFYSSLGQLGTLVLGKKESLRYTRFAAKYRELQDGMQIYRRLV